MPYFPKCPVFLDAMSFWSHTSFRQPSFLSAQPLLFALIGLFSVLIIGCDNGNQANSGTAKTAFVAVTQIVEKPRWNAVREGVKVALADAGYKDGETLRWEWRSAKGSPVTAAQIAQKYARAKPDVIVAIAPLSAQLVTQATQTTPIVFSAVTDPLSTDLVKNVDRPGGNATGVSDRFPIDQQLALIKEILPQAKAIGIIYSATENQAVSLVKEQAAEQGFTEVKEATVLDVNEAVGAARSFVGAVDAIYLPTDRVVSPAIESVVQVGQDNDMPVFASGIDAVERGAIASLSFNYYDIGLQTGEMVIKVLRGSRPGDLSVEYINVVQLSVNPSSAKEMGVALPDVVTERADTVVESQTL